ncbi:MAG: hypothetical protein WCT04_18030 [Planctomycetota bacterium]
MSSLEAEYEDVCARLNMLGCEGFSLDCSVVGNATTGTLEIAIIAVNELDESFRIPDLKLPPGWIKSDYWYWAESPNAMCGSVFKGDS